MNPPALPTADRWWLVGDVPIAAANERGYGCGFAELIVAMQNLPHRNAGQIDEITKQGQQ